VFNCTGNYSDIKKFLLHVYYLCPHEDLQAVFYSLDFI
jgi:hypothetical protein